MAQTAKIKPRVIDRLLPLWPVGSESIMSTLLQARYPDKY